MYRKLVWCYLVVLILLDISLNTKISAQGKSHGNGVSIHESLMEGISLQEWGKEPEGEPRAPAAPAGLVALSPARLSLGRAALAEPHARTVTLTNTGNETIHLASVAGTTPDFHASFFDSKTLVPAANTTFSVVYLGRREGPVSALLYIHTSKGVLHYPVSAVGVASPWRVWPLVGVRVPLNATLEPLLTVYNPTDTTVQVSEVYSSGSWVGLALPAGGASAPRGHWALPPRAERALVRLRLRAPPDPQAAYVRIKGDMPGGALVVCVEASAAPAGEYLDPLQLRLPARGSGDPPATWTVSAGSSSGRAAPLQAGVRTRCGPGAAPGPAPPGPGPLHDAGRTLLHNGQHAEGAAVRLLRDSLDAHHPLAPVATLTLDYAAMWASAQTSAAESANGAGAESANGAENANGGSGASERGEAWCAGWVRVGRAAAPYSVRLLRGTLAFHPTELHVVTASGASALTSREVRARNEFDDPVHIHRVSFPEELQELFDTESLAPLVVAGGGSAAVARVRLRAAAAGATLESLLRVHTNVSDYTVPVLLYEGRLHVEWEWPHGGGEAGALALGAVTASSTHRVRARLHNRGAARLCVRAAAATLAGATLEVGAPCAPAGGAVGAVLTVVAPARAAPLAGTVHVDTQHARTEVRVTLHAYHGRVHVPTLLLDNVAPYVWAEAPLVVESSMPVRMRTEDVTQPPDGADPALLYIPPAEEEARWAGAGAGGAVGALRYRAEAACEPACPTGLRAHAPEGAAWRARGSAPLHALAEDATLRRARRDLWRPRDRNLTLLVVTDRGSAPALAAVRWAWPALAAPPPAPLAPVGGPAALHVRVRNPSAHPLLLQPVVSGAPLAPDVDSCRPPCEWAAPAFTVGEWRVSRGAAEPAPPYVLLQGGAEIEVAMHFSPHKAAELAATLYLRNNLTVLEAVPLRGRGALPTFQLDGRPPNSSSPLLLEVVECGAEGAGTVRRTVVVRNTGAVSVRLRDWRVAGVPCLARGFRLHPCAPLTLAPNHTRALTLAFTPDWTRARAAAPLTVRAAAHTAHYTLRASAPARLLARCATAAPRPPFEPALRTLGGALALLALAAAVALGALDAERALRRHRREPAAPPPAHAPAPLDLRALGRAAPAAAPARPAPPAPARRRRAPRPRAPALDAAAERRAFERWRAEVSRRAPAAHSASSEGGGEGGARGGTSSESSPSPARAPPAPALRYPPSSTGSDSSERSEPELEEAPRAPPARPRPHASPHRDREPRDNSHTPPMHAHPTEPRADSACGPPARAAGSARARSGSARSGARKERLARRRARAHSPPAARGSPARGAGRAAPPAAVRWGASWSSVVSRGAQPEPAPAPPHPPPLAPIGSDVRRRAPSHSLFYYGGAPQEAPPAPAPPPAWPPGAEEPYRSLESVWGAPAEPLPPAAWLWGVRPPPGFAAPRAPRPFDPFHSLASIWTPAALDWRRRDPTDPNEPAPPHPTDQ